ncbi:MAG TPA: relaxase/mobilization nuclease domain-containing protein [Puia sp.]|jgi:hypothetical protein|nr:relaxase/mobilization nuclease domain-containing protein [Puia sp.]
MVARIAITRSPTDTLTYNEEKVSQRKAEFIHAGNFLEDKTDLTYSSKLRRFQHLNELNARSQAKMLHATLNFQPGEHLSNDQLSAIADRYMHGLGMSDQPYLVYKHKDANHPHIHIVSTLIRPDGSRIRDSYMATRLSEPTRKAIEKEFHLQVVKRRSQSPIPTPDQVRKITPDSKTPVTQSMDQVLSMVTHHYNFTDLHEFNAILRGYNLTAETGRPGSKTHRHQGIYYTALDDQGNKMSPPVMASQLSSRPTSAKLNEKFRQSRSARADGLSSVRQRLDWILDQQPSTLRAMVSELQRDSIEVVTSPANGRNPHEQIYVDHRTRIAVSGEVLGAAYTSAGLAKSFRPQKQQASRQQPQKQTPDSSHFNKNVPQLLSSLLHSTPDDEGPNQLSKYKSLSNRPKM